MKNRLCSIAVLWSMLGLGAGAASAEVADSGSAVYFLEDRSTFGRGCFSMCACPITLEPMKGTFELKRAAPDPLFENYEVTNVRWVVPRPDGDVRISGSGKYRIGGEFAIQQQMSLDLVVGDNEPQHFDSGVVLGGGGFPKIDIEISLHQNMSCFDTVMHVQAVPAVAGVGDRRSFQLHRVKPNPFVTGADVELTLLRAGAVDVKIYDPMGRAVRSLASGAWLDAGPHSLAWDGRGDDGVECAAGLYFVRAEADHRVQLRRVAKLK